MFNCYGFIGVRSGSDGRGLSQSMGNGRVTISGALNGEDNFQRIVTFNEGRVSSNKYMVNGKVETHIVYGSYEKNNLTGEVVRFKRGTAKAKHGKARCFESLLGNPGVCHSWYSGRLVRQKFIYDNGVVAYDYKCGSLKPFVVKDYFGAELYEISGRLVTRNSAYHGGHSAFNQPMEELFSHSAPFCVKKKGKVFYKGEVKERQKVGEWVVNGKKYYYVNGVQIPKKLYETPPEKLNLLDILKIDNAQLRMAMMSKLPEERTAPEEMAKLGKVIDVDKGKNDMVLYDIKNYDVRILRVRCHTTKAYYYLKVPKDSKKCEAARQWTFGVGETFDKPIVFEKET